MKKLPFRYPNVSFSQTAKIEFNYQSRALLKNFFFLHQFSPPKCRLSTYLVSLAILKVNLQFTKKLHYLQLKDKHISV